MTNAEPKNIDNVGDIPSIAEAAKQMADTGEDIAERISNKAGELGSKARDIADRTGRAVNKGYEKIVEKSRNAYEQGRDAAGRWEKSAEDCIQKRPVSSLLVAAGVGCVLGMFLRHSMNNK